MHPENAPRGQSERPEILSDGGCLQVPDAGLATLGFGGGLTGLLGSGGGHRDSMQLASFSRPLLRLPRRSA